MFTLKVLVTSYRYWIHFFNRFLSCFIFRQWHTLRALTTYCMWHSKLYSYNKDCGTSWGSVPATWTRDQENPKSQHYKRRGLDYRPAPTIEESTHSKSYRHPILPFQTLPNISRVKSRVSFVAFLITTPVPMKPVANEIPPLCVWQCICFLWLYLTGQTCWKWFSASCSTICHHKDNSEYL